MFLLCLQTDAEDQTTSDLAVVLFETSTLRSGYQLTDTKAYGDIIERMLRLSMNVDLGEQVCVLQDSKERLQRQLKCLRVAYCLFLQVEEEPEEEAEEPAEDAEDAEDEEEVQADDDADEESVSVVSSLCVSQQKLLMIIEYGLVVTCLLLFLPVFNRQNRVVKLFDWRGRGFGLMQSDDNILVLSVWVGWGNGGWVFLRRCFCLIFFFFTFLHDCKFVNI